MKKFVLAATTAIALTASSALAADLDTPYTAPPPRPVVSWTGPYLGVNVGYSWGSSKSDWTASALGSTALASETQDVDGIIGGFQSGINWQTGGWVYGLEIDFQASGQQGEATYPVLAGLVNVVADHKLKWLGTARSRLGFLWTDYALVYATVGVAYGQLETDYTLNIGTTNVAALNFRDTRAGWTVGGGVETAFGAGWSGKVEYLYVDLGKQQVTATAVGIANLTWDNRFQDQIVRAGLNYRWGASR